jgi:hypothetical protein
MLWLATRDGSTHPPARPRRPRRRLWVVPFLALAVSLGSAAPAIADDPEHTYGGQQVTNPIPFFPPGGTCDGFAPLITFTSEYNIINFYDNAGRLVKQIRHVTFTGTLYNSTDLSKSIPYDGDFTRTFYPLENAVTFTGLRFRVHKPGEGVLALQVGRDIVDLVSGEQTFLDGNHNREEFAAEICRLLR